VEIKIQAATCVLILATLALASFSSRLDTWSPRFGLLALFYLVTAAAISLGVGKVAAGSEYEESLVSLTMWAMVFGGIALHAVFRRRPK